MPLGLRAWEGGDRQRPASQETCRQSWSHASTLGGVSWWVLSRLLPGAAEQTAFAVTCHVIASPLMTSLIVSTPRHRRVLLCSVALSCLVASIDARAQSE